MSCSACFTRWSRWWPNKRETCVQRFFVDMHYINKTDSSSTLNHSKEMCCENKDGSKSGSRKPKLVSKKTEVRSPRTPSGLAVLLTLVTIPGSQCWLACNPEENVNQSLHRTILLGLVRPTALHSVDKIGQAGFGAKLNWQVRARLGRLIWHSPRGVEKPGTW